MIALSVLNRGGAKRHSIPEVAAFASKASRMVPLQLTPPLTVIRLTPAARAGRAKAADRHKWRNRRWTTLIIANLLFVVSYYFDVQLLEGALTASRLVGFHMADLNSALQVILAYKHLVLNLVIGTVTVLLPLAATDSK